MIYKIQFAYLKKILYNFYSSEPAYKKTVSEQPIREWKESKALFSYLDNHTQSLCLGLSYHNLLTNHWINSLE